MLDRLWAAGWEEGDQRYLRDPLFSTLEELIQHFREQPLNEKSTLRFPCPRLGQEHLRELQMDDRIYRAWPITFCVP